MKKIYFVYFTTPEHIDMLKLSLKSLNMLDHYSIAKVFIYLNHINKNQFLKIRTELDDLKLRFSIKLGMRKYFNNYCGWGLKDFNSEMRIYLEINEEIGKPEMMICQVNTDVLFISDNIFDKIMESDADMIGHICENKDGTYVQGGIYFLKNSIIPEIMNISFHQVIGKICSIMDITSNKCAEDTIITYCVKEIGKVQYLKMQLPINLLRSLTEKNLKIYAEQDSVIHFHQCSSKYSEMLRISKMLLDIKNKKSRVEVEVKKK